MAKHREFKGKSLEECLTEASETLGIPDEKIHYRLLDEGRRGVFGLGARDVRILVEVPAGKPAKPAKPAKLAKPAKPAEPSRPAGQAPNRRHGRRRAGGRKRGARGEEPRAGADAGEAKRANRGARRKASKGKRQGGGGRGRATDGGKQEPKTKGAPDAGHRDDIAQTVGRMFRLMGLELEGEATPDKNGLVVELGGPDTEMLLDNDAELLFAVQFLLNRMSRRAWPGSGRIQLTCAGFRTRRDEDLVSEIREVASQVTRTGEAKRLQPMNPYERRLVHLTIREFAGLSTRSEGDGFMKAIVVSRSETS